MDINMLNDMLEDLQHYRRDKAEIMENCINDRLAKSLEQYYKELNDSLNFLLRKNGTDVLKNIAKM